MIESMSQLSVDSEQDFRFEAEMSAPKKLIPMLRSIHITKHTVMAITSRGLKMTCEDTGRSLQANSFIDRSLFSRYYMSSELIPITICFKLSDLLNALTVLGTSATPVGQLPSHCLRITYCTTDHKLVLHLREDNVETTAKVRTIDRSDELMVFHMNSVNKVILNADPIVHFWKCADLSSECIEVGVTDQVLRWTTETTRAKMNHNIQRDSEDVQQFLHSVDVSHRYNMSLMKFTLKALIHSSKLSVRIDSEGLLSLQFMVKLDNSEEDLCFVEYFIVPQIPQHLYQS